MLDVVFIILRSCLKIIYSEKSIVITNLFKSYMPPHLINPLPLIYHIIKTQSYITQRENGG